MLCSGCERPAGKCWGHDPCECGHPRRSHYNGRGHCGKIVGHGCGNGASYIYCYMQGCRRFKRAKKVKAD